MRQDVVQAIMEMYELIGNARSNQLESGSPDQGKRVGITSGKHLDPVAAIIKSDLVEAGFRPEEIYDTGRQCTLPGWFRPTKDWDILAFDEGSLIGAVELKSIGSSFGNNANNRAEEAIGSVVDARQAFSESLYGECSVPPAMGYAMIVRMCEESGKISKGSPSPHFAIDPVFDNVSYLDRFLILCDRLRRSSLYNAVWLVFADPDTGDVYEPSPDMTYEKFIKTMALSLGVHRA